MTEGKPIFKIKDERLGPIINAFRIKSSAFLEIEQICLKTGVPIQEVVRRMIDFAIEHLENPNEACK